MDGFYGKILIVDMSTSSFKIETLEDKILGTYLGGKGLASYLLFTLNPGGVDPLSPENCLIFATGPAGGSSVWGSCRYGVFTKSPLTGFYSESYSGGKAPEAMDSAGFDAIVIRGRAKHPAALYIHPEGVDFHDAGDLWGLSTFDTQDAAVERYGRSDKGYKKPGAVVIGPAGENLVRFAVIENDYWRSAGRTGVGTVMGSKRLKAIVFQGDQKRSINNEAALWDTSKAMARESRENPGVAAYKSMGTPMMVNVMNNAGAFPTRYWSQGVCEHKDKINADALHTRCRVKPRACLKCFMACGRMTEVLEGRHAGLKLEGPEYETIYAFGGLCMVDSIEEIVYLNDVCDRLGMDTITAGNLCAFAIEAARRGKIDSDLDYGQAENIAHLLELISAKEGIGAVLAEGIRHAAEIWGLEDLAVHVKGMEPAGYDPRVLKGMGLAYAVSDRGACHLRTTFYKPELAGMIKPDQLDGKAEMLIDFEDRLTLFDTLILCRFYRDLYPWDGLGDIIRYITGLDADNEMLKKIAGSVSDVVRRFNIREGLTLEDDRLPKALHRSLANDGKTITEEELLVMLKDYYRLRGWNENGIPEN